MYFRSSSRLTCVSVNIVLELDLSGIKTFGYTNCYWPITGYNASFNSLISTGSISRRSVNCGSIKSIGDIIVSGLTTLNRGLKIAGAMNTNLIFIDTGGTYTWNPAYNDIYLFRLKSSDTSFHFQATLNLPSMVYTNSSQKLTIYKILNTVSFTLTITSSGKIEFFILTKV